MVSCFQSMKHKLVQYADYRAGLSLVGQQSKCASSLCDTPSSSHLSLHYLPSCGSGTTFCKSLMTGVWSSVNTLIIRWVIICCCLPIGIAISVRLTLGQKSKSQALTNDVAFTLRHCLRRFGDNRAVNQAEKGCSRICFVKFKGMKMLAECWFQEKFGQEA